MDDHVLGGIIYGGLLFTILMAVGGLVPALLTAGVCWLYYLISR